MKKTLLTTISVLAFSIAAANNAHARNILMFPLNPGFNIAGGYSSHGEPKPTPTPNPTPTHETTPDPEPDLECYSGSNLGSIGTAYPCLDKLIVQNYQLQDVINGVYSGTLYTAHGRNWDETNVFTGQVHTFDSLYEGRNNINPAIVNWDTSNLSSMISTFKDSNMNIDISGWNVSKVVYFASTFENAVNFNQPIGSWDMASARYTNKMFKNATNFNQNINSWSVNNVQAIVEMFAYASSFNQPLNNWNLVNIFYNYNMTGLFYNSGFNQDISNWCIPDQTVEPNYFSDGSPLTESHKPVWGTCL